MKAYEFPIKITQEGNFKIPDVIKDRLPIDQTVRVIILVSDPTDVDEQSDWDRLTAEQFLAGYSQADAIYDKL
jgi:hypothetical protein